MNKNLIFKVSLFVLSLMSISATGQDFKVQDNSPYSRLGLGDLFNQNFSAIRGMGGLSAAYNDPLQVNLQNPASLGTLQATTFEVGMYGQYSSLSDADQSVEVWSGNLSYLSLGFTTKNRLNQVLDQKESPWSWGMNFSLLPYSNVNYGVQLKSSVRDTAEVINFFEGNGGTYRLMWGNGVRYNNFSAGINLGYLFGKINNDRNLGIIEAPAYDIFTKKGVSIRGFVWNFGVQYDHIFKKPQGDAKEPTGKILTFGLTGNSATDFTTTSSLLEFRSNNSFTDVDTFQNVQGLKQNGKLPGQFSAGVILREQNKWKIGVNYAFGNWSQYENEGLPDDQKLNDSWEFSFGGEFIPDHLSYNRYYKKVRYRAGAFYGKDPRLDLKNYGVTIGFGLPIILPRQTASFINLSLEVGQLKGPSDSNLLEETYVNLNAGFTLNDNSWFFKRKFN